MEKTIVSAAMAAVLGLALAGCSSNGMKDKIAGKYTAELTPGVTYEFKATASSCKMPTAKAAR